MPLLLLQAPQPKPPTWAPLFAAAAAAAAVVVCFTEAKRSWEEEEVLFTGLSCGGISRVH